MQMKSFAKNVSLGPSGSIGAAPGGDDANALAGQ